MDMLSRGLQTIKAKFVSHLLNYFSHFSIKIAMGLLASFFLSVYQLLIEFPQDYLFMVLVLARKFRNIPQQHATKL